LKGRHVPKLGVESIHTHAHTHTHTHTIIDEIYASQAVHVVRHSLI